MAKTILIVDDSESIREVVNFTLVNEGYSVLVGEDGEDALKHLNGQTIDLVITDLHMPKKDGIELIREIRKMSDYQRIPILFLTTESQQAKKMEAKEAGATGWIIKPFVPAKLTAAISKVLR
jgi:two-component system chemotaxis response regulator CheY